MTVRDAVFQTRGEALLKWRRETQQPDPTPSKEQYLAWADKARRQAEDATTQAARAIHLEIAADYDAKAARAE